MEAALQWTAFAVFSAIAIAGALGMTSTMGMFRSGVFLMASFFGVAGLFILLSADLLAWLTVMMYVGGLLVMILFMVLVSSDPGGDMMASMMSLSGPERVFSLGLARAAADAEAPQDGHGGEAPEHGDGHADATSRTSHGLGTTGMSHEDTSMFTPVKRSAMLAAALLGANLVGLVVLRPEWRVASAVPDPDSARRVGHLLMGKYMLAFEGAGLLILLGVYGGVLAARPGRHTGARDRAAIEAASEAAPEPVGGGEAPDERPPPAHDHGGHGARA